MRCKRISDCRLQIADLAIGLVVVVAIGGFSVIALADTAAERAARLEKLSASEKEELLRKKQRFDKLDLEEQARLRKLHESLSAKPDAAQLEGVLIRYSNWLKGLNSAQRSEILDMPAEERVARIKQIVRMQEQQRFRDFVDYNLPGPDQESINKWLDKFVEANEKDILSEIRDDRDRRRIREIDDAQARRRVLITKLNSRWFNPRMPFPSDAEIDAMAATLSETTRKELEKAKEPKERLDRMKHMVGAAIFSINFPHPSEDELRKFYAALPADKRAPLENLEPAELLPELRRLYRMDQFAKQGGPWRGGPRPPGGEGPRGRGGPGPGGPGPGGFGAPPPDFGQQPPGFASPTPDKKK